MRSRGRSTPSNAAISSAVLRESRFRQVIVDPRTNEEAAAVVEQFRTQGI
jgi:hypothetical protein